MILERIFFNKFPDAWSLLGAVIIVGGALKVALAKQAKTPAEETESRRKAAEEASKAERGALGGDDSDEESDEEGAVFPGRQRAGSGVQAARGVDLER